MVYAEEAQGEMIQVNCPPTHKERVLFIHSKNVLTNDIFVKETCNNTLIVYKNNGICIQPFLKTRCHVCCREAHSNTQEILFLWSVNAIWVKREALLREGFYLYLYYQLFLKYT